MDEPKLLPCPFCGGEAEIRKRGTPRASMIIGCTNCGCLLESCDVIGRTAPASYAWNRRMPTPSTETPVVNPNQGLHAKRVNEHNPREAAFAEAWAEHDRLHLLENLLIVNCDPETPGAQARFGGVGGHFVEPVGRATDRDRVIVATVIQWLGSNIGISFLEEALGKFGAKLVFPPHSRGTPSASITAQEPKTP